MYVCMYVCIYTYDVNINYFTLTQQWHAQPSVVVDALASPDG